MSLTTSDIMIHTEREALSCKFTTQSSRGAILDFKRECEHLMQANKF